MRISTTTTRSKRHDYQNSGSNRYDCKLPLTIPLTHNLRALAWNANAVTTKKAELELFLRLSNIDVAAISETKLTPNRRFTITGFNVLRSDRNRYGGGVMLLIKDSLLHDAFPLPKMSGLEATAVCLHLQNQKRLIFISAYLPPTITIAQADLDAVFSSHCPVVLAGDFNCKHIAWNNVTVNSNGDSLLAYCLNTAISINYPDQPTHYPYNSHPSVLDIAVSHHCTASKLFLRCLPTTIP